MKFSIYGLELDSSVNRKFKKQMLRRKRLKKKSEKGKRLFDIDGA